MLTLKFKESRLSPNGLFFLRAVRTQSTAAEIALRPDAEGYITLDLGANGEKPEVLVRDGEQSVTWTIPQELVDRYRAFEIGPVKLINEAGRELRTKAIVGLRWTVQDWISTYGVQYGVSSVFYVRQMCRGDRIGRTEYYAKLPAPFRGVKEGEGKGGKWFITV